MIPLLDSQLDPFDIGEVRIRRVTVGVSLLDCASQLPATVRARTYDRIRRIGGALTEAVDVATEFYGLPCDDVELVVTPISVIAETLQPHDLTGVAQAIDSAALDARIDAVFGFSTVGAANSRPGCRSLAKAIPGVLASTSTINASLEWDAGMGAASNSTVWRFAEVLRELADLSASKPSHFMRVRCGPSTNAAPLYHAVSAPEIVVGVDVTCGALEQVYSRGAAVERTSPEGAIERSAFRAVRAAEHLGKRIAIDLGSRTGNRVETGTATTSWTPLLSDARKPSGASHLSTRVVPRGSRAAHLAAMAALERGIRMASPSAFVGELPAYDNHVDGSLASVLGRRARIFAIPDSFSVEQIVEEILGRTLRPDTPLARAVTVVMSDHAPGDILDLPPFGSVQVSDAGSFLW